MNVCTSRSRGHVLLCLYVCMKLCSCVCVCVCLCVCVFMHAHVLTCASAHMFVLLRGCAPQYKDTDTWMHRQHRHTRHKKKKVHSYSDLSCVASPAKCRGPTGSARACLSRAVAPTSAKKAAHVRASFVRTQRTHTFAIVCAHATYVCTHVRKPTFLYTYYIFGHWDARSKIARQSRVPKHEPEARPKMAVGALPWSIPTP